MDLNHLYDNLIWAIGHFHFFDNDVATDLYFGLIEDMCNTLDIDESEAMKRFQFVAITYKVVYTVGY